MNKQRLLPVCLISIFLGMSFNVFSQTTINAASNQVLIQGKIFEYSIGEMSLVSTEQNQDIIVTQGYLQPTAPPNESNPNSSSVPVDLSDIHVYPNPTENILFIETLNSDVNTIYYQLLDATGKTILQKNEYQSAGANKFSIDLRNLSAGTYFLIFNNNASSNSDMTINKMASLTSRNLSFKIQKIH